jgi:hypothetical protein
MKQESCSAVGSIYGSVNRLALESYNQRSPIVADFLRGFDKYLCLYEELQSAGQYALREYLFDLGREIKAGKKSWTEADVNRIVRWKRLHPLWRRIKQGSADLETCLSVALIQANNEDRVGAMCEIPGFGPVLACALLTLTWPESYGILDNPAWTALRLLKFDLPLRPYSGGGFSVADAEQYQAIIRTLGRARRRLPVQVANALHAFGKTRNGSKHSPSRGVLQEPPPRASFLLKNTLGDHD